MAEKDQAWRSERGYETASNDYLLWALPTLLAYRDQRGTINQPDLSTVTPLAFAQQVQTRSNSAA
jgi:hypothetical protein